MNKFKVGDIVKDIESDWIFEVTSIEGECFSAMTLYAENKGMIGLIYGPLNSKNFKILDNEDAANLGRMLINKLIEDNEYIFNKVFVNVILTPYILEKKEQKYLENIIEPFKDDVSYIQKCEKASIYEYIRIAYKNSMICTLLPDFKKGSMYKGMVLNKKYIIEELGI